MLQHLFNQSINQSIFRIEQEDREKKEREIKEAKERELKENEMRKFAALTATGQLPPNMNPYEAQIMELRRYATLAGLPPTPQTLAAIAASQQSLQNIAAGQANAAAAAAAAGHPGGFPPGMNPLAHGGNPTSQQQAMTTNSNVTSSAAEAALHNERLQNELKMQHSATVAHLANLQHTDPAMAAQIMAASQLSSLPPNLAQASQQAQSQSNALGGQPNQPPHLLGQPGQGGLENNQLHHPNLSHPMMPPGFNPAALANRGPNPALFPRPEHLNHPGAGLLRPHGYDEQALAQQVRLPSFINYYELISEPK